MSNEKYRKKLISLLPNCCVPSDSLHFSAIAVMKDKTEFYGVNIKNSVFRDGIYAEQAAIGQALTSGYKKGDFERIYVMVGSSNIKDLKYLNRNVIYEFVENAKDVVCMNLFGEEIIIPVGSLYPYFFDDH